MNTLNNLTASQLRQAADLKEKIASLETQLGQLLAGRTSAPAPTTASGASKPRRIMSPAAIAKIRAGQKKRWAKVRAAAAANPNAPKAPKQKRVKMSPAVKAKLSAKMKALWAARNAAKK